MTKKKKAKPKAKPPPKKPAANRTNRTRQVTAPDWGPSFLAALARTGNIRASCEAVGKSRSTVYERRDTDEPFAQAMAEALEDACDDMELEARRRAVDGCPRLKFHQGNPILVPLIGADGVPQLDAEGDPFLVPYVEHEYSDTLMVILLKAHRPEKFRENVQIDHTGNLKVTVSAGDLSDDELAAIAKG